MNTYHSASAGDIARSHWPVEYDKSVNLYLGTGRCGGCFDAYGLQHQDPNSPVATRVSRTWLAHADVWHQGRHGIDVQVPLACLTWSEPPGRPDGYHQTLELPAGRLTTDYAKPDFRYTLTAWTSPAEDMRDLLFFEIVWQGSKRPDLVLRAVPVSQTNYCGDLEAVTESILSSDNAILKIQRGTSTGVVDCHCRGDLQRDAEAGHVTFQLDGTTGRGLLVLAMGPAERSRQLEKTLNKVMVQSPNQLKSQAEAAWRERWGSRKQSIPLDPLLAQLYWRFQYYLLCSNAPDVRCPPPPMGFSGNAWGFHFPQDLSYIHPALIAHGHTDITRAHIEFYHSRLDNQRAITKTIYGKPGVCWSWEFPIRPEATLFRPEDGGAPNPFQYEIHNAAYPAKMAIDTAEALNDPEWTRDIAWPIARESARFLAGCLEREANGKWSIYVTPSMGQDEFGGPNAKNYLCALYATEYTLKQAIKLSQVCHGKEYTECMEWKSILKSGLAYERLLLPDLGFYRANESIPFEACCQKHPVQLNPIWLLPLGREPDTPTLNAWCQRRLICSNDRDSQRHPGVPTGYYDGWTLFAFLLSASKLGDTPGFFHEVNEMLPARLVDPDFITVYESSGFWQPYYTTSMGLFLQAMDSAASFLNS